MNNGTAVEAELARFPELAVLATKELSATIRPLAEAWLLPANGAGYRHREL
jgi:hypothetical protein